MFSSDLSNEEVVVVHPSNGYHVREIAPPAASGLLCYRRIRAPEKPVSGAGSTRTRVERFPGGHAPESRPCPRGVWRAIGLSGDQKDQENRLRAQVQVRDHSFNYKRRTVTEIDP